MKQLQMVDLQAQYHDIKHLIDAEIQEVLDTTRFIGGPKVDAFAANLATYMGAKHVIPCANGTDALQIAMMALDLKPGDEVIVPAFTYVATAEVIALLGLKPVIVDVDHDTFNIQYERIFDAYSRRTKAIVPVHLFGQSVDMDPILRFAEKHGIYVIEDNAQAIGADYTLGNNSQKKTGTMGHIGCTSFFPSKNLGCYGDGGAINTDDAELAHRIKTIANHGQNRLYYHDEIGVNSRLDALQAAILNVKLPLLDQYNTARRKAADFYDAAFKGVSALETPLRAENTTHVFHQYTLQVLGGKRDELKTFLAQKGVPSMVYYPVPLYRQAAFAKYYDGQPLPNTEILCQQVISLPMHSHLTNSDLERIVDAVREFFK